MLQPYPVFAYILQSVGRLSGLFYLFNKKNIYMCLLFLIHMYLFIYFAWK